MSNRILIADDEPSNAKILGEELTDRGYSVETTNNGSTTLKKVESSPPDLIILDYMMPDLSGLDVLKELRKRGNDTPVIMITAYGSIERAVEAMKEGAYDFITPLSKNDFGIIGPKPIYTGNFGPISTVDISLWLHVGVCSVKGPCPI